MAMIKEQSKTFPLWFQDETVNANYRDEYMTCLKNITQSSGDTSWSKVTASGLGGYYGSVLSPNGTDVYFCPNGVTAVAKWDTLTDTQSTFGVTSGSLLGGVLAPNGFIYMIPYNSTAVVKINPSDDSITTFGSLVGSSKWVGGVCTRDGIIYCCTNSATQILKIDTNTDTTSLIGVGINGYYSGCIAPNGFIYFVRTSGNQVLKLDPSNDTTSTITIPASATWYGAALLENGCIYAFPWNHTNGAMKIDTNTDTITLIAGVGGSGKMYGSVSVGSDGFAYGIPWGTSDLQSINPADDSVTLVAAGSNFTGNEYAGAVTASNGITYCSPRLGNTVLKIGDSRETDKDFGLSNFNNKG